MLEALDEVHPLFSLAEKRQVDKSKDEIMKSEQKRQMVFSSFSTQKKKAGKSVVASY